MKKYLLFLLILIFVTGCSLTNKEKSILARINNYEITKEEFEEEFKTSVFAGEDVLESKKEFLDNLINRKLILQDAQAKGLNKDKGFLKMIEKFWEQSLLKIALDRKAREIAGSVQVSDKEIEEAYNKMLKEGKATKTYEQMYSQIKWEIVKLKESEVMEDWLAQLRKRAKIHINEDLLR